MDSEYHPLHIFLFPFLAHGHMIPIIDMAKLFAEKHVKITIITSPFNASSISKIIGKAKTSSNRIHIQTVKLACEEAGLPNGCENVELLPSLDLISNFCEATKLLQEPFEQLLLEQQPDCVVADMFYPWTADSAAKFGIPRLEFHGTGFFSLCLMECIRLYEPYKNVSSDSEPFVIPNLPGKIKITRMKLAPHMSDITKISKESELRTYGEVVNSFYELEKDYADHFRKQPRSVVYICFGSFVILPDSQLREIATGLEASGQQFIWAVRKSKEDGEDWLPDGFEKRMEGVPMVTWPVDADQFYNEKLVTDVLKIGVPVGVKKWVGFEGDSITWDKVEKAVKRIMAGDDVDEIRNKVKVLSHMAREAVEERGSSCLDLNALIQELSTQRH
ncbi:hypothetical protein VNO77_04714 [Canavalia gladiata]|uniref:Uncharacterized protein n=1 Tax=Canavalia gladiata TaxID=3824 RepID=A0AAN9R811_CANGL